MLRLQLVCFLLLSFPLLMSADGVDTDANVLVYEGGTVQVTSEVNVYENIVAGAPISGSVLITHDANQTIDATSFSMDNKPLKVDFVKTVTMSNYSKLVLSIYHFQITGLPAGSYTLAPIKVTIGGKEYAAPPMTIDVAAASS